MRAFLVFDTLLALRLKYPALWGLKFYKRFISPLNPEPCAAHQHMGASCGTVAIRHLEMNGSQLARELINAQLGLCAGLARTAKRGGGCGKIYDSGSE
jgi:putative component of membrane protein insertase Oxa1/YidC/SpoIIIJ protein YidD